MRGAIGTNPKSLLSVTGALEALTGLMLLIAPAVLVELLLGAAPVTGIGLTVSRLAGAALLALGVACWLARIEATGPVANGLVSAMLLYNVAVVAVLVLSCTSQGLFGVVFWPVVLLHSWLAAWCVACLSTHSREEKRS